MAYYTKLTSAGAAKQAAAIAAKVPLSLTTIELGDSDGTSYQPTGSETALKRVVYTAGINELTVDPNDSTRYIAKVILPPESGGYYIREVGIKDTDGTLIMIGCVPETYKPLLAEGSGKTLTVSVYCAFSNELSISLAIDPTTVLATRSYVDSTAASTLAAANTNIASTATNTLTSANQYTTDAISAYNNDRYLYDNLLINSEFVVWSRLGVSVAVTSASVAAPVQFCTGWYASSSGPVTLSKEDAPLGGDAYRRPGTNCGLKMVCNAGNPCVYQYVEGIRAVSDQYITISFDLYSPVAMPFIVKVVPAINEPDKAVSGVVSVVAGLRRYSITLKVPDLTGCTINANATAVVFGDNSPTTVKTGTFYLSRVKAEFGHIATPFKSEPNPIMYDRCDRVYTSSYGNNVKPGTVYSVGNSCPIAFAWQNSSTSWYTVTVKHRSRMTGAPIITFYDPTTADTTGIGCLNSGSHVNATVNLLYNSSDGFSAAVNITSPTVGYTYAFNYTAEL